MKLTKWLPIRPLFHRSSSVPPFKLSLATLPIDLLFEVFEDTHLDALLLLISTCHRLRTLALGWVLRHYRITGILSFKEEVDLSSGDEAVLESNFKVIRNISIFLSSEFRRADDFQARWKFLEVLVVNLPNLSSFTFQAASYCDAVLYHHKLVRMLWDASLKSGATAIGNGRDPYVLGSKSKREMLTIQPCIASAHPLRRGSAVAGHMTKALISAMLRAAAIKLGQARSERPNSSYRPDYPSITLKYIHTPSKRFTLFIANLESLTVLHIDSTGIPQLDWGLVLPDLDFPHLDSVTIHHDCRGLTTKSLNNFLIRHPSITELVVTVNDRELMQEESFQHCLPNLKILAGPVHVVVSILRSIKTPLKLTRVKITEYHANFRIVPYHKPLDFSALDTALDILASCPLKQLGIGLPGLGESKDWLTKASPSRIGGESFGVLETVCIWLYDCKPMDRHLKAWLGHFRDRNFPRIEQVHIVQHFKSVGFPVLQCRPYSGSVF